MTNKGMKLPIPPFATLFRLDNDMEVECDGFGEAVKLKKVSYDGDDLKVYNRNLDFLRDPRFLKAYNRGMQSGHHIMRPKGSDIDIKIQYRVYIATWLANMAKKLDGDFVECGVNTGIYSLSICDYVEFQSLKKKFYLFDTFSGIPISHVSESDNKKMIETHNERFYSECYELAKTNFAPYENVHLVRGTVPETLGTVPIDKVAYLSLDLNISQPELEALEFFWDKLVPGGVVLFDDYAWRGYEAQKILEDEFVRSKGYEILTLPTGQGLIIKLIH